MRNSARSWAAALSFVLMLPALAATATAAAPKPLAPSALLRTLAGSGLPLASFGVYVQAVGDRTEVAAINAEEPFVLASTAKIVTALAALDMLGPRWRWRTHAYITGAIVGGRLKGDLLIAGGGNARLTSSELAAWMRHMRSLGLNEIAGDILLDHSAFTLTDADHRHTPLPAPDRPRHAWPAALMLDEGVMHR